MAIRLIESKNIYHSAVATSQWQQQEFYFEISDSFDAVNVDIPIYFNLHWTASNAVIGDSVLVDDVKLTAAGNELNFKNSNGFEITSAKPGEAVTANFTRVAGAESTDTVLYILGTYEKDDVTGVERLVEIDYFNNVTSTGINANTISTPITMPGKVEGKTYKLKAYVWDGTENLKPIESAMVTQSK